MIKNVSPFSKCIDNADYSLEFFSTFKYSSRSQKSHIIPKSSTSAHLLINKIKHNYIV